MFEGLTIRHWRWQRQDNGVLHLILDHADADTNTLSRAVMAELAQMTERLSIEPPKGLVLLSGKPSGFIAGADVSEFRDVAEDDSVIDNVIRGQRLFEQIARLPCPTVAAIDGYCMGGGTELALACDHRVCSDRAATRIGLPEVMLGLHPGWGGCVRLPRLLGPTAALDLILSGRSWSASRALGKGLVDRAVNAEQLIEAAEALIQRGKKPRRAPWYLRLGNRWPLRWAIASMVQKRLRAKVNPQHYPAPYAALKLWRKHGGNGAKMMRAEARSFARLAATDTARNLLRVFFLRETLGQLSGGQPAQIERVHVVGAGVMGGDIAAWCALRGFKVSLQDRSQAQVEPAVQRARALFRKKLKKDDAVQTASDRLQVDLEGQQVGNADLVIEAIFENLEAKRELLQELEAKMRDDAILATNTSSIPLQELRQSLHQPQRFLGLHFFNPVAKMPLLEIVHHDQLNATIKQRAAAFAKAIDKFPLAVTSTPGFLVNRILMPYLLEAVTLYTEGHPSAVIDKAATRFGMPMGPIELADQVGLDVCLSVAQVLSDGLGVEIPPHLEHMLKEGKRGKKDGEGFYQYQDGKPIKTAPPDGYQPPADLTDRLIMPFLNEAVSCLREGVVDNPDLLDAGLIFGTGFAPFRGGPWQYIQDVGAAPLRQKLIALQQQHGDRFEPDQGWNTL